MMKNVVKRFFWTAAFIPLLAACGGNPDTGSTTSGASPKMAMEAAAALPAPAVEALEVTRGNLAADIEASGVIRGISEVTVVTETEGIIEEVLFELGGTVAKGRPLLRLGDTIQRLNSEEAAQVLEAARLQLSAAERLHSQGGVSQSDLLQARSAVKGAEARYAAVKKAYEDRTIDAPISGRIAVKDSSITQGNYLSRGLRVAVITDLTFLRMEIAVGEREVRFLSAGDPAFVTVPACGDTPVEAVVKAVAAGSDPSTGSFSVLIEWKNSCGDQVRSGMSASVIISASGAEREILVPASAVISEGTSRVVYLVSEGKAVKRSIQTGERVGNRQVVLSGLKTGETLIVSGLSMLRENDEVAATLVGRTGDAK